MNSNKNIFDVIRARRSIRKFKPDPVPSEVFEQLIEAAAWAPSASNRQDWFFTVVTSSEIKTRMAEAVNKCWQNIIEENKDFGAIEEIREYADSFADFVHAPVVIVISSSKPNEFQKQLLRDNAATATGSAASAAMAAQNLMLCAHALGLGSCCMTGALAASEELVSLTGLSKKMQVVCLIALGYSDESPSAPERKAVSEISRFVE